jgi:hypothetical protein
MTVKNISNFPRDKKKSGIRPTGKFLSGALDSTLTATIPAIAPTAWQPARDRSSTD